MLLLEARADVNAKDSRGVTSLDYSTELNESFFEDEKTAGITITQTMEFRNEDGSANRVTMNNAKIKENRENQRGIHAHGNGNPPQTLEILQNL